MRHQALTKQTAHSGDDGEKNKAPDSVTLLEVILLILCRAASSAVLSHTGGFGVGGGVHDSYTFQCGLVGSFAFPGIDTR